MSQPAHNPSPLSPPPAPNLPAEVLGNIIEELIPDDEGVEDSSWVGDVRALSLVSQAWVRETQRVLFYSASLHPAHYWLGNKVFKGPDTLSAFADLMAASPHLGQYVKNIKIIIPRNRSSAYHKFTESAAPIARALDRIPRLFRLDLQNEWKKAVDLEDIHNCDTHRRLDKKFSATLVGRAKNPNMFIQAIQRLLPQVTELGLHNISLPAGFLSPCTNMKHLDLRCANLSFNPRGPKQPAFPCPALKSLELDAHALVCLKELLEHPAGNKLRAKLAELEELLMEVQAPERLNENSAQHLLLGRLTGLRSLYMMGSYFNPADDQDLVHATSPLVHLNPASFSTLVTLSFNSHFNLEDDDALIKDPYQGFLCGGVISMLTRLEHLMMLVTMERRTWGGYDGVAFLGDQCQWSELDRVLVPRDEARLVLPRLSKIEMDVSLWCSVLDATAHELHAKVTKQVSECQLPSIICLHKKGEIDLCYSGEVLERKG